MLPSSALQPGELFAARYRVVRCLKQGGMGSVFQVIDERTDRLRALKVMQSEIATDPEMRLRFEKEASDRRSRALRPFG
jgi:serine/threonine protein kinase